MSVWKHDLKALIAIATIAIGQSAAASTVTSSFNVQITITSDCVVSSTQTLDFGSNGVLHNSVDASATLGVQCTDGTPYNIGLDAGSGSGASVGTRLMTNASSTVAYTLYQDSARTSTWGDTAGTNTKSGTGNGQVQTYTVFGRVPAQTTPAAGTYTDTIGVTVTF